MEKGNYHPLPELVPQDLVDKVRKYAPAQLCDGMKTLGIAREGCMDSVLMPLDANKYMIGTACTVDTADGDNFPVHVALYQCRPGYVMVIAGKGYDGKAYLGDLIGSAGAAIGLEGMVIDGCVRDKTNLTALDMPVYAKGFMQRGPGKKNPGGINVPVVCAGVTVNPGDLVVGDYDGVTVIPRERIEEVLVETAKKDDYERKRREAIAEYVRCRKENRPLPDLAPGWVKEML
jgi:regulator of RNase E activity RraA